jgi:hypothetical protein
MTIIEDGSILRAVAGLLSLKSDQIYAPGRTGF